MNHEFTILQAEIVLRVLEIDGKKVMTDTDLAQLYGVQVMHLNQAVKRNIDRFPDDFICYIEPKNLISQFVISSDQSAWGGRRKKVTLFTEQGIAMLSSVLRSKRATLVNIEIMRAFVRMRQLLLSQQGLRLKVEDLEKRFDENFKIVFDALREVIETEENKTEIGFKTEGN